MARRNPRQGLPDRVATRYKRNLKSIEISKAVPFGEQEVTPSEFRAQFPTMSKAAIQKTLDENGQAEVLKQLRGK